MNRFTKMLLIAAMALGSFAVFSADTAEAGHFHGGGCYRPAHYSSYSYGGYCYRPSYNYCSTYVAPVCYRPSYYSCYTSPAYCGTYGGGYGGYGGYSPVANYGCYAVPANYGYGGW
jgi:hypothetical protein